MILDSFYLLSISIFAKLKNMKLVLLCNPVSFPHVQQHNFKAEIMKIRKQEEIVSDHNSFPKKKGVSDILLAIKQFMNTRIPESNFIILP